MSKLDSKFGHDSYRPRVRQGKGKTSSDAYFGVINSVLVRPVEVPRDTVGVGEGVEFVEPLLETAEPPAVVGVVEVALHRDELSLRRGRAVRRRVDELIPVARHVSQIRPHAVEVIRCRSNCPACAHLLNRSILLRNGVELVVEADLVDLPACRESGSVLVG
jgi:hypothetical protein